MIHHETPPEHVVSPVTYLTIFGVLLVLTVVTVAVAFFDLGALNVLVALGIAVIKAAFVILYFMHLRDSSRLTQTVVLVGLLFFVIFLTFTFGDYWTRGWDLRLIREAPEGG
jgi:cytochrome c oxidase subunit 4